MTPPPPVPVAVAVVRRGDRVLVRPRREEGPLAGVLEFPGGKVRPGEDPIAAAVRETREETGMAATPGAVLDTVEHAYPDRHVHLTFVAATVAPDAEPTPGWRWVTPSELRASPTPAANAGVIAGL